MKPTLPPSLTRPCPIYMQVIERAFGLLVGRWGIFWRAIRFRFDLIPLVRHALMKTSNVIMVDHYRVLQTSQHVR